MIVTAIPVITALRLKDFGIKREADIIERANSHQRGIFIQNITVKFVDKLSSTISMTADISIDKVDLQPLKENIKMNKDLPANICLGIRIQQGTRPLERQLRLRETPWFQILSISISFFSRGVTRLKICSNNYLKDPVSILQLEITLNL